MKTEDRPKRGWWRRIAVVKWVGLLMVSAALQAGDISYGPISQSAICEDTASRDACEP